MADKQILPDHLANAARCLEERLELLHIPCRRIPEVEWSNLPVKIKSMIPPWIPPLLASRCLAGGVLEYRDKNGAFVRQFAFFEPTDYAKTFDEGSLFRTLFEFGFLPFANEADGNVWVTELKEGPASPVYLLELSDWNGSFPNKQNGLIWTYRNLSDLLTIMGISECKAT